jgi:dihydrofolate synthase / folylpolyglutamate synthase
LREELRYLASLEGSGIRPGLERIRTVLRAAGRPELSYETVIVAGTNGKGSTAATLESILDAAGCRTALYTSPHLVDIRERWRIDRAPASPALFRAAVRRLREAVAMVGFTPTYFEALTLVAFIMFELAEREVAVLEVGMGGRLDATNVTRPLAALVTRIAFDHVSYLGTTIRAIAREKAGVIHRGSVALTSNTSAEVVATLARRASGAGAPLHVTAGETRVSRFRPLADGSRFDLETPLGHYRLRTPLAGEHQVENVSLAVRAAEELAGRFPTIDKVAIERGVRETQWRGRLERFTIGDAEVVVDGGHNADAAEVIARYVTGHVPRPRTLVFGIMSDKDVEVTAAAILPLFDEVVVTEPDPLRATPAGELRRIAEKYVARVHSAKRPASAIRRALELAPRRIVVCGSLYLAGAAVELLDRLKASQPAAASRSSDTAHATPID